MADYDRHQLARIATHIRKNPKPYMGLDFYTLPDAEGNRILAPHMFPEENHGDAVEFFFFMCMQNYGFWYGTDQGYGGPLYGHINGVRYKGSDLLTVALKSHIDRWPYYKVGEPNPKPKSGSFDPCELEGMSWDGFVRMFQMDGGVIPFPDLEERYKLTRAYARWFRDRGLHPQDILDEANASNEPLHELIALTTHIPGYNRDSLVKKNYLLAMALSQRPEQFLDVKDFYNWRPVVDYHLMRVALRLGIIRLTEQEAMQLQSRTWCDEFTEERVRRATHRAVQSLLRRTNVTMFELDELLWSARRYCPEETIPNCEKCFFNPVCEKRVELFQPVFRTTNY